MDTRFIRKQIGFAKRDASKARISARMESQVTAANRKVERMRAALHELRHEDGAQRLEECHKAGCSFRRPTRGCSNCGGEGYVSFY